MASYTYSTTASSVTITATGLTAGDLVRFFARRSDTFDLLLNTSTTATGPTASATCGGLSIGVAYVINVYVNNVNLGNTTITISDASGGNRPENWAWEIYIASNASIGLTAVEWNSFCQRINTFRGYKGLKSYDFTVVHPGMYIAASYINQAVAAINELTGAQSLSSVGVNTPIYASIFISLAAVLNSVA